MTEMLPSTPTTGEYEILFRTATPVISPDAGSYEGSQTITLTCSTVGALIYYTTNGADPTTSSTLYTAPFTISAPGTVVVKAIAKRVNAVQSEIASNTYTLTAALYLAGTRTFSSSTGYTGGIYKWNNADAIPVVAYATSATSAMVNLNGKVYIGCWNGRLYEWTLAGGLVEVAGQYEAGSYIDSMVVHNGSIYAGAHPGGKLLRWNGTDAWVLCADTLNSQQYIYSLISFAGYIFGGTGQDGNLFRSNGSYWTKVADQLGTYDNEIRSLCVWNNWIYGGTSNSGQLLKWDGGGATGHWTVQAPRLGTETIIYALAVFNNRLYGGTFPNGYLYRLNSFGTAWEQVAGAYSGSDYAIYSLVVNNGKLYGATRYGHLLEWNGVDTWVSVGSNNGYPINAMTLVT